MLSHSFETSDTKMLCDILGIEESSADWYDNELDSDLKMQHSVLYYSLKSLREKEEELQFENDNYSLRYFGFTEGWTKVIVDSITTDKVDCRLLFLMAVSYLENAFSYYPLINEMNRYPYNPTDVWFEHGISTLKRQEPENIPDVFNIKMINISKSSNDEMVQTFLIESDQDNADTVLLYHGTNHASAVSILTKGINIFQGKSNKDFSTGNGFYLSEKFKLAHDWGNRYKDGRPFAIVVFKVPKSLLDVNTQHGLDVCDNRSLWEEIIRYYRSNKIGHNSELFENVSFIRGYICKSHIVEEDTEIEGFDTPDYQTCIRSEDYAVKFGSLRNIHCVIFY